MKLKSRTGPPHVVAIVDNRREIGDPPVLQTIKAIALANPLELYTAVIATVGVAFWILDRRSMMAALRATKGSEVTSLRLKRQEVEASVERNFLELQLRCQATREAWRNHELRNGIVLRSGFDTPQEEKENMRVERAGILLLDRHKASAPNREIADIEALESYFEAADRTSLEITRLSSQLPKPTRVSH